MQTFNSRYARAGIGAAALLLTGAGGYWAHALAEAPSAAAVNAPGRIGPPSAPGSFADIIAKVAPAVVSIDVVETAGGNSTGRGPQGMPFDFGPNGPSPQQDAPLRGSGSGFFISPDGYIATNNHVVEGAEKITIRTTDDRHFTASVVGRDPATDLAVIKVDGGPFPFVSFEQKARPRVGDWVVAVGNPFGLGGTATAGIVSALGRQDVSGSSFVNYMQIDAPINKGNSGGPTFDVDGRVVGVNSAIFSPSGGSVGIGFDIPADVAEAITKQLIAAGHVTRGYIGASIQNLSPELADSLGLRSQKGALVAQVTDGGPAAQAGLQRGDVIASVNGHAVESAPDLTRQVALARPGETIKLGVARDAALRNVAVRSGVRPSEAALASNDHGDRGSDEGGADSGQ